MRELALKKTIRRQMCRKSIQFCNRKIEKFYSLDKHEIMFKTKLKLKSGKNLISKLSPKSNFMMQENK